MISTNNRYKIYKNKYVFITSYVIFISCMPMLGHSKEYHFDTSFLGEIGNNIDVAQFENENSTPEGEYLVDIYVNSDFYKTKLIKFVKNKQNKVVPELTKLDFINFGVNAESLPVFKSTGNDINLLELQKYIPDATENFDIKKLRLDINIPQAYMDIKALRSTNRELWDQGIPAMVLNYTLNASNLKSKTSGFSDTKNNNLFFSAFGGFNFDAWRLRGTMNYIYNRTKSEFGVTTQKDLSWNNIRLERDIQKINSELSIGEVSTNSVIFDQFEYRGLLLQSNDSMLPAEERNFAPVISGVANSNAQITITQNGTVIYQTSVAPGPYKITDIYSTNSVGDLVVTVKEADGKTYITTYPYSSLPMMLREGKKIYSASVGKYRNGGYTSDAKSPLFAMASLSAGLINNITLYGGLLGSNNYRSLGVGIGLSLGAFGALSLDGTYANASLSHNRRADGGSFRAKYSKSLLESGTTIDLTTYRYSTSNFYSFTDANTDDYSLNEGWSPWFKERRKSSWQTSITQTLGNLGVIRISGRRDDYWGSSRIVNTLDLGFSSSVGRIGYNLNYSINHYEKTKTDWPTNHQFSVNVSVPFNAFDNDKFNLSSISYGYSQNNRGDISNQASVNGNLDANNGSWYTSFQHDNNGKGTGLNLGASYNSGYGNSSLGYYTSSDNKMVMGSFNGGVVAHRGGILFSDTLSDAIAIVSTPDAKGISVGVSKTKTNSSGYAIYPSLQSYQRNSITLDPLSFANGIDIENNSTNVYPTKGAVVLAKFKTKVGYQAILTLKNNKKSIPFGASAILVGDDTNISILDENSTVYMSGLPKKGTLKVVWGNKPDQTCNAPFSINDNDANSGSDINIVYKTLVCN
ncbi:fimbria/pilus outer membrane usher protein [Providencia sneebia]|uniref:Outer membrane usher protein n=1 Tax=Providencia sneebia DSM 19967 TaxID=1141660 RepID=K8WXP3_9GAMM|nr:fimbria/pilus outer membrane usher protein [Providencia sneebia]EKT60975.1 outer membrane usher protein [Providencia sneebia DSM 19967]